MGSAKLEDGRIVIQITSHHDLVYLPDPLTAEFLEAAFATAFDEPGNVDALHGRMPPEEKERFRRACEDAGGALRQQWSMAALAYASIGTLEGRWDVTRMKFRFRERLTTPAVEEILLADTDVWFARNKFGMFTDTEFKQRYGFHLNGYLEQQMATMTKQLGRVVEIISSGVVERTVTLVCPKGVLTERRRGPAAVSAKYWVYEPGETFMSEEEE